MTGVGDRQDIQGDNMPKTLTQKILEKHVVAGEYREGEEIGVRIDQTLTQDATGNHGLSPVRGHGS